MDYCKCLKCGTISTWNECSNGVDESPTCIMCESGVLTSCSMDEAIAQANSNDNDETNSK